MGIFKNIEECHSQNSESNNDSAKNSYKLEHPKRAFDSLPLASGGSSWLFDGSQSAAGYIKEVEDNAYSH
jgi:hypothetical protein